MIHPLKPARRLRSEFTVTDIENYPNGDLIGIGVCWRDNNDRIIHRYFIDWQAWWDWLVEAIKHPRHRRIYAHNGGRWDWLSLVRWLAKQKEGFEHIDGIMSGGRLICLKLRIGKIAVDLCDSLALLKESLDSLGKCFFGEGKIDTGGKLPHEIYATDPDKYYEYLKRDCELLLRVIEKAGELIFTKIAKVKSLKLTVGSTAMMIWKHFLDRPITVPTSATVKSFLREGYTGGRVEVFQPGYIGAVKIFDVCSMYPYVMANCDVPTCGDGWWSGSFDAARKGIYQIDFVQRDKSIPAVLGQYAGEATVFDPEIRLLMELGVSLRIKKGYIFAEKGKLFREYVDKLYPLKQENKGNGLGVLTKFLLNSLYGKTAQHATGGKIVWMDTYEPNEKTIDGPVPFHGDEEFGYVLERTSCPHEHVGIAGVITSEARCHLYRGMLAAGKDLIYVDTDSIHTAGQFDFKIGSSLGDWNLESQAEGAYAGKKIYALRMKGGEEKIRVKGITVKRKENDNGFRLEFKDICRIIKGDKITARYRQPATAREVFRGLDPCRFMDRTRTIARTA